MPDREQLDMVFIDTETLGLHPDAPIWEFAAVRRFANGGEDATEFRIQHDPGDWVVEMMDTPNGEQFVADYARRYNRDDAASEFDAAVMINMMTRGAVVVGCNPGFDLERIAKLMRGWNVEPAWHYRPICVTTMGAGYLHGFSQRTRMAGVTFGPIANRTLPVPWSSDDISRQLGVNPDDFPRHTAMGDVRWAAAQYDAITRGTS